LDFRSGVVGKRLIQQIACDTFGIPGNDLFEFFEDIEGPAAGQHAVDDDLDVLVVESIYRTDGSLAPSGFSLVDQGVVVVGKDSEDGHTFSHEWAYGLGFCHDCDPNNYTWGNSAQDLHLIGDEDCDTEMGSRTFVKLYQPLQRLCNGIANSPQYSPSVTKPLNLVTKPKLALQRRTPSERSDRAKGFDGESSANGDGQCTALGQRPERIESIPPWAPKMRPYFAIFFCD